MKELSFHSDGHFWLSREQFDRYHHIYWLREYLSAAVQNPCCAAHATETNGVQSTAMPLSFLVWTALHTRVQLTQDVIKAIAFALVLELRQKLCSILFPRSFSSYSFLYFHFLKLSFFIFSLQRRQIDTNEYAWVMGEKRQRMGD